MKKKIKRNLKKVNKKAMKKVKGGAIVMRDKNGAIVCGTNVK